MISLYIIFLFDEYSFQYDCPVVEAILDYAKANLVMFNIFIKVGKMVQIDKIFSPSINIGNIFFFERSHLFVTEIERKHLFLCKEVLFELKCLFDQIKKNLDWPSSKSLITKISFPPILSVRPDPNKHYQTPSGSDASKIDFTKRIGQDDLLLKSKMGEIFMFHYFFGIELWLICQNETCPA